MYPRDHTLFLSLYILLSYKFYQALYGYNAFHVENIEIYNAGQQTDLGRYPFHFHMCLDANQNNPYIKGCSIHDTFSRCVTIHGSNGVLVILFIYFKNKI